VIADSKKAELTAKAEEDLNKPLIEKAPKAGKIASVITNQQFGTTEWILKNGVKVVFKPTKFKEDEILLSAFSQGGLSKVRKIADLPSAMLASSIVSSNGLGAFNQIDLDKVLTGKIASVSPFIDQYTEGFDGNSSVKDFETMLQLIYLNFTAIRKDDNSFKALMNMYNASLVNRANDPRSAFSDSVNVWITNKHPRNVIVNVDMLKKVDQDKAIAFFKERFAVPADFTFVFTGNVNPDDEAVKNAVLTYLGGLKSKKKTEKFTDNKIRKPQGEVKKYFTKEMKINKASNFILYNASLPYNVQTRTLMTAIGNILSMRYLESIREKEGGSYGVGVRGAMSNLPVPEATLLMQFDTDPEKQEKLMGIIHAEVAEIVKNGPRPEDVQKVKENMLKKIDEDLAENSWWESAIVRLYQDKLNLVTDYKASVDAINPLLIQETLKKVTEQGNVLEVVMLPAK
jgi:zinc protease